MKRSKLNSSLLLCGMVFSALAPMTHASTMQTQTKGMGNVTNHRSKNSSSPVSNFSWGGGTGTFDSSTGVVTLSAGSITNPGPLRDAVAASGGDEIKKIIINGPLQMSGDLGYTFWGLSNLTSIDGAEHLDTTHATGMFQMFMNDVALTHLNLSSFDTSNVTNMANLFNGDVALTDLDVSSFNTSKATSMYSMFNGDAALTHLDVSHFETSNVTSMESMFNGDATLTDLDVSSFDTSKVTSMESMFNGDVALTHLDLSHFNTSKSTNTGSLLGGDVALKVLKLGENFQSLAQTNLPNIAPSSLYDGKWQNVGTGTEDQPNGSYIWSSGDFMTNFVPKFADTYVWKQRVNGGDITVHYQDDKGATINPDVLLKGEVDDDYQTEKKVISGYTFKEVHGNASGKFTTAPQTVTYLYTKGVPPVAGGNVTVKYVDDSGKAIASSEVLKGNVGDQYTSDQKNIKGYHYHKTQGDAKGTFTVKAQTVSYIYTKNVPPISEVAVYRAYNPNSGEHVYTTSKFEYESLIKVGWRGEGMQWNAPTKGSPIYRAYNPNSGEHFYTSSRFEYQSITVHGWRKEGIGFFSGATKGQAIYRAFNPNATGPGSHFYTPSNYEYNSITAHGWKKEGVAFYALSK